VPSYSPEFKEQTVRKLMPPHNRTVASLSQEIGVSEATLYNWKKQFRAKGYVVPKRSTIADQWDAKAKLAAVIQTAAMNEAERSEYCRKHGLYPEQIDAWKAAFEASEPGQAAPSSKSDLAAERKKSRALEKELRRKEKALAEAAALLTLSKKAQAIWGTNEDD
jgi:transposase